MKSVLYWYKIMRKCKHIFIHYPFHTVKRKVRVKHVLIFIAAAFLWWFADVNETRIHSHVIYLFCYFQRVIFFLLRAKRFNVRHTKGSQCRLNRHNIFTTDKPNRWNNIQNAHFSFDWIGFFINKLSLEIPTSRMICATQ